MVDKIELDAKANQLAQIEALKNKIMLQIMTKEARERMGNIRVANPTLALQVELYLMQLYQNGQIKSKITEEQLKQILSLLVKKKETKIVRK